MSANEQSDDEQLISGSAGSVVCFTGESESGQVNYVTLAEQNVTRCRGLSGGICVC
jgi:hypothetical protein